MMDHKDASAPAQSDLPPPYSPPSQPGNFPTQPGYYASQAQYPNQPPNPAQAPYPTQTPYPQGQAPYPQGQVPYPQGQYPYPQGQGPAPPGFQSVPLQQPVTGQPTMIIQQPLVGTYYPDAKGAPMATVCPQCRASVVTEVNFVPGALAWILCLLLCFFGCTLGCCLIPFCVNSCLDAVHTCPQCNAVILKHNRL